MYCLPCILVGLTCFTVSILIILYIYPVDDEYYSRYNTEVFFT